MFGKRTTLHIIARLIHSPFNSKDRNEYAETRTRLIQTLRTTLIRCIAVFQGDTIDETTGIITALSYREV